MAQDILSNEEALITQSGYQKIEEELEKFESKKKEEQEKEKDEVGKEI